MVFNNTDYEKAFPRDESKPDIVKDDSPGDVLEAAEKVEEKTEVIEPAAEDHAEDEKVGDD